MVEKVIKTYNYDFSKLDKKKVIFENSLQTH